MGDVALGLARFTANLTTSVCTFLPSSVEETAINNGEAFVIDRLTDTYLTKDFVSIV